MNADRIPALPKKVLLKKKIPFFIAAVMIFFLPSVLFGCEKYNEVPGSLDSFGNVEQSGSASDSEAVFFDWEKVSIKLTKSIDVEIKNYCMYQDIYGDIVILGELFNNSTTTKTNINFTFEFLDSKEKSIDFLKIPADTDYVLNGGSVPFCLVYEKKENYINLNEVKIGVDYLNYNKQFLGQPVVYAESFNYTDRKLEISGNIINLGQSEIEDLKLFAVFYNNKNQVIFIRKCYIEDDKMQPQQSLNFSVELILDEYLQFFTHYKLDVFYRDSLKVQVF
jgi:hypothetical protein